MQQRIGRRGHPDIGSGRAPYVRENDASGYSTGLQAPQRSVEMQNRPAQSDGEDVARVRAPHAVARQDRRERVRYPRLRRRGRACGSRRDRTRRRAHDFLRAHEPAHPHRGVHGDDIERQPAMEDRESFREGGAPEDLLDS